MPSAREARQHLHRCTVGRKMMEKMGAPPRWQRIAVDVLLAELERLEQENVGMVITELTAWDTEEVEV